MKLPSALYVPSWFWNKFYYSHSCNWINLHPKPLSYAALILNHWTKSHWSRNVENKIQVLCLFEHHPQQNLVAIDVIAWQLWQLKWRHTQWPEIVTGACGNESCQSWQCLSSVTLSGHRIPILHYSLLHFNHNYNTSHHQCNEMFSHKKIFASTL